MCNILRAFLLIALLEGRGGYDTLLSHVSGFSEIICFTSNLVKLYSRPYICSKQVSPRFRCRFLLATGFFPTHQITSWTKIIKSTLVLEFLLTFSSQAHFIFLFFGTCAIIVNQRGLNGNLLSVSLLFMHYSLSLITYHM